MSDAVRRYKDIVGELTDIADRLREHDGEQAVALKRRLVELDNAMVRAEDRAAMSRLALELRWEAVLEALWAESWLTLRPRPAPAPDADPEQLDALDRELDLAADGVLAAIRRRLPFLR